MTDKQFKTAELLLNSRELARKLVTEVACLESYCKTGNFENYPVSLTYYDGACSIPAPIVPGLVEWLKQKAGDYFTRTQQDFAEYLCK